MNDRLVYLISLVTEAKQLEKIKLEALEQLSLRKNAEAAIVDIIQVMFAKLPKLQGLLFTSQLEIYCESCVCYLNIFSTMTHYQDIIDAIDLGLVNRKGTRENFKHDLEQIDTWYNKCKLEMIPDVDILVDLEKHYVRLLEEKYMTVLNHRNN